MLPQVGAADRDLMRARTSAKRSPGTATSAIWNIVFLAWLTILAPILINLSWTLRRDQWDISPGRAKRLRKLPRF